MMAVPALIEIQYFPPIQFFSKCLIYSSIVLDQHENYRKGTYRNRTQIAGANGKLRLTVPLVKGKNQRQNIKEVKISYVEPWQHQHWMAIQSAYGNAPYFDYYADYIEPFFRQPYEFLFQLNTAILDQLIKILQIPVSIQFSDIFQPITDIDLIDLRNTIHPKKSILDPHYKEVTYPQVFEDKLGFLSNLSILDLLFCQGPETILILEKSIRK